MQRRDQALKIAILAMGGEGGGVLADWLVALGEANGFIAQTTSVPGVAQRTGATIYYVELFSAAAAQAAQAAPVLALMPLPGDVDVVLASELMEAARAVQRGLVTPQRTTLVASTHRVFAMSEKMAMGDGRADAAALLAQAQSAAQRFVAWDMAAAADEAHSVISAVLFGALAGSGVLPFDRTQFEATIRAGGVGVAPSLVAFGAAYARAAQAKASPSPVASVPPAGPISVVGPESTSTGLHGAPALALAAHPAIQALLLRARDGYDGATLALVTEGLRRCVDYQDPAYAGLYLNRLDALRMALDNPQRAANSAQRQALLQDSARHLALWMSYEDTIRVADLKTRDQRFARVHNEIKATATQVVTINEYLHPRLEEICDTLPAPLGRWLLASGAPRRLVQRLASHGRVVQTSSLRGYLLLSAVAGLRRWRRGTLRFVKETERIEQWLADVQQAVHRGHLDLALEIARCQRLVKGYGDTHERGLRSFGLLRSTWADQAQPISAPALIGLREAALADEHGDALKAALRAWQEGVA